MRTRRLMVSFATIALLTGCGIPVDSQPRDITDPRSPVTTAAAGGPTTVPQGAGARVYFISSVPGRPDRLQAVPRKADSTVPDVMRQLLAGLLKDERPTLQNAIPPETQMLSATLSADGTAEINLDQTFFNAKGDQLLRAVAQIVFTAFSAQSDVKQVRILVDGVPREWPRGDGTRQSRPLKQEDFAELSPSTQPDYVLAPK